MAVIKGPEDDGVMKLVMRSARNATKAEADLRALKLFDVRNAADEIVAEKSRNRVKTSAVNQILLEHRDCYVRQTEQAEKYEAAFNRLESDMKADGKVDGKTLCQMMGLITKNNAEATRHLENMGKNVNAQTADLAKTTSQMQKMLKDIGQARIAQQQHNDRMEILEVSTWAKIEEKSGMSRAEIEAEMYEDEEEV